MVVGIERVKRSVTVATELAALDWMNSTSGVGYGIITAASPGPAADRALELRRDAIRCCAAADKAKQQGVWASRDWDRGGVDKNELSWNRRSFKAIMLRL